MSNLQALIDSMETALSEEPLFYVEPPDGRKLIAELPRQTTFLAMMRIMAPAVEVRAIPNAGKRNPMQARREGIRSGVFDIAAWWQGGHALIELKGYSQGRPGKLSPNQIDFGNVMHRMGHNVACFFTPERAVEWLRECGAPVRGAR